MTFVYPRCGTKIDFGGVAGGGFSARSASDASRRTDFARDVYLCAGLRRRHQRFGL